jgi:hypothetical protein
MRLPEKVEKEKKKKGEYQSPPAVGGRALERLHQYEQERGLPETNLEKPECDDSDKEEKTSSD